MCKMSSIFQNSYFKILFEFGRLKNLSLCVLSVFSGDDIEMMLKSFVLCVFSNWFCGRLLTTFFP